ncbi:acyl-coenzyme A diphosphatase NUDT19 isoform X3 [Zeugodacus cucurbitae]|uniref:acyl-coenzyme A diphosphatase NUDT19 isoform X2 n=1 Tax=Zeugodacus cucurbitae TaxID=28588 RepID=UPI0023D91BD9|nr:acyl-coenzyme A diphosphatase NUDT19 isoform X2 [Zeugodacus cucurbitae]XP_054082297.1 acyl-coenzyme A diphosphatase NUDT19 isoform X3 [Zeugodacus cucurbitae]
MKMILLFERTTNTAYAPGHCVFPGGTFEEASDECQEWIDYFKEYGVTSNQLDRLIVKETNIKRASPLLTSGKNFPRDISLRITACRETFEEVGILFFRNHETLKRLNSAPTFGENFEDVNFDRVGWQFAVHNDAKQFLNLCRRLHIVPDLWCLYEWSLWRSPFTAKKRYDTVFYFASLTKTPALLMEHNEVKSAMWKTASEFLALHKKRKIWLPPPQVYELVQLSKFENLQNLTKYASEHSIQGTELLAPFYYKSSDALIGVLPGDDLYPSEQNNQSSTLDYSSDELKYMAKDLHRIVSFDMHQTVIQKNISSRDNHLNIFEKCKL